MSKPKMAVVRAFPRIPEFGFYTKFSKFDIKLIGNTPSIDEYFKKNFPKVESVCLRLKPAWIIDPVKILFKEYTHKSWVYFDGLEKELEDCDVINISDTFYFYCRQCAEISKKENKQLVSVIWESYKNHPSRFVFPYSSNIKKTVVSLDLAILRSNRAKLFTDAIGIQTQKTKVIYKGVDRSFFSKKPKSNGSKPVKILYIGQLIESKGVIDLISAFEKLVEDGLKVELIIAGQGGLENIINNKSKSLPIKLLGKVSYSKLPDIYSSSDIFCSPSKDLKYFGIKTWEECFSYTLMEAQASGLPIATTISGGIPEEVGEGNILCNPGDVEAIYNGLKSYVEKPQLREIVGKENKKRAVVLFDAKVQAVKTEDAVISLINSRD